MKPANNAMQWLYDHWMKATPFLAFYSFILIWLYVRGAELRALPHLDADADLLAARVRGVYMSRRLSRLFQPQTTWVGAGRLSADEGWFFLDKYSAGLYSFLPLSGVVSHFCGIEWGLWTAYFSALNALAHVVMFFYLRTEIQSGAVGKCFGEYSIRHLHGVVFSRQRSRIDRCKCS